MCSVEELTIKISLPNAYSVSSTVVHYKISFFKEKNTIIFNEINLVLVRFFCYDIFIRG